jgi:WD40 repeat protein
MKNVFLFSILGLSFLISACSLGDRPLTEKNIDEVEVLATFGIPSKNCLVASGLDSALETRVVNGQTEYLLASKDQNSRNIQVWNLGTEKIIETFNDINADAVLFAPDQRTLITFTRYERGTLTLWNIQSGNQQQKYTFEPNHYYDERISISPDGLSIALFSAPYDVENSRVSEFNLQTSKLNNTDYVFPLFAETPPPHIYAPNGKLIAVTYNHDNKLHFLDLKNNTDTVLQFPFANLNDVTVAEAIISTIAISSNEKYLVGGTLSGDIYLWNVTAGTLLKTIKAHTTARTDGWLGGIKILEFSPNSNLLLSVGYDGFTKLWDATTGTLLKEINSCPYFGGFTQDGRYLVTVGKKGIELWGIP